jgi:hypothetical protein
MAPVKGAKVVVYHPDFIYLLTRFGLVQLGTIEDRPASRRRRAPRQAHRADEAGEGEGRAGRAVERPQARRARGAGSRREGLVVASAVGAVKGADNYVAAIDYNIRMLSRALA